MSLVFKPLKEKNPFIISKKNNECNWFHNQLINKIYRDEGLFGIYKFLWDNKLTILEDKSTHYMDRVNGNTIWCNNQEKYIQIIISSIRDRYLHRKLIITIRNWLNKPVYINKNDLCYNPFYNEYGDIITEFAQLYYKNNVFCFSKVDIENIICNSLETIEDIRSVPTMPKNPYNGKEFNTYELKVLYDFLVNTSKSDNVDKCYNKTKKTDKIPETIRLFRYANFDLDIFKIKFCQYLKITACFNYVKELNNEDLAIDLSTAFKKLDINDYPNLRLIGIYITDYKSNILSILGKFYYLYYYISIDSKNQASNEESDPELSMLLTIKNKLQLIKREIYIYGNQKKRKIITKPKIENKIFHFKAGCDNKIPIVGVVFSKKTHYKKRKGKVKTINFNFPELDLVNFTVISSSNSKIDIEDNENCQFSRDFREIGNFIQGEIVIKEI